MSSTSDRLVTHKKFQEERDPAARERRGNAFARGELAFLLDQLDAGTVKLDLLANALRDLAAELQCPPGSVIIKANDPEVPLRSKDFPA